MTQLHTAWILIWLASFIFKTHCKSLSTYSTNEVWSTSSETYKRPKWAQKVSIVYDDSQIWSVEGVVVPLSTKGRNVAPKPYNGYSVGDDLNLDKGHVMALSNGGPDIKHNIVPQSSQWQRTGGWRKLETMIFDYAVSKYKWNPSSIYHASEVEHVRSPGYKKLVTYNVTMSQYDKKRGEPMKYIGFIKSGEMEVYSFTIKPGKDAVWKDKIAPQSSKYQAQYDDDNTMLSNSATVAIILLIGLLVFCLFIIMVLVYKWMKRGRIEDNVKDNYQQLDETEITLTTQNK